MKAVKMVEQIFVCDYHLLDLGVKLKHLFRAASPLPRIGCLSFLVERNQNRKCVIRHHDHSAKRGDSTRNDEQRQGG